jgi:hypothetical protein
MAFLLRSCPTTPRRPRTAPLYDSWAGPHAVVVLVWFSPWQLDYRCAGSGRFEQWHWAGLRRRREAWLPHRAPRRLGPYLPTGDPDRCCCDSSGSAGLLGSINLEGDHRLDAGGLGCAGDRPVDQARRMLTKARDLLTGRASTCASSARRSLSCTACSYLKPRPGFVSRSTACSTALTQSTHRWASTAHMRGLGAVKRFPGFALHRVSLRYPYAGCSESP